MRKSIKYIFAAIAVLCGTAAYAQGDPNAIHAEKWRSATPNADGSYTLTLDTYVTGSQDIIVGSEEVDAQVDAILVVDVSGSMQKAFGAGLSRTSMQANKPEGYYTYPDGDNNYIARRSGSSYQYYGPNRGTWAWRSLPNNATVYKSRMGGVMDAMDSFVAKLSEKTKTGITHRVSIITFSSELLETTVLELGNGVIVKDSYSSITDAIHSLKADGATRADLGMNLAVTQSANFRHEKNSSNVVVFFTDGDPTGYSSFQNAVASPTIEAANSIKSTAKIFSVTVDPNAGENARRYLNYVSSNYTPVSMGSKTDTKVRSYKNGQEYNRDVTYNDYLSWRPSPDDAATLHEPYSFSADTPEKLDGIFRAIVDNVGDPTGGAGYKFDASDDVQIKDIVTPAFTVPEGATVKYYTIPIVKDSSTPDGWIFDETKKQPYTPKSGEVVVSGSLVSLKGYNFSEHWCGIVTYYHNRGTKDNPVKGDPITDDPKYAPVANKNGAKLRIEFDIMPSGNGEGGVEYTNDKESGIYVNGQPTAPIKSYDMPVPIESNDIDLVITRDDLKEGQSTIYNVTRSDGSSWKVAVSAEKDGANQVKAETRLRVVARDADKNLYTYKVAEDHTWDWTTTHTEGDNVMQKKLIDESDATHPVNDNHFDFGVTERTDAIPNNDETFVRIK